MLQWIVDKTNSETTLVENDYACSMLLKVGLDEAQILGSQFWITTKSSFNECRWKITSLQGVVGDNYNWPMYDEYSTNGYLDEVDDVIHNDIWTISTMI